MAAGAVGAYVRPRVNEGRFLRCRCAFVGKERDEFLGRVVAPLPLNESVQVADVPHGIDFDVEKQFAVVARKLHRARRTALRPWC